MEAPRGDKLKGVISASKHRGSSLTPLALGLSWREHSLSREENFPTQRPSKPASILEILCALLANSD